MGESKQKEILFVGGDSPQWDKAIARICEEHFNGQEVERHTFDAAGGEIPRALDEVLSFSLFTACRVVILNRLDKAKEKEYGLLENYLKAPRGDTPLILFAEAKKGIPKSILTALGKSGVQELKNTSPAKIREAVRRRCEKQNVNLTHDAEDYFMECCGDDVGFALNELNKLLLWAEEGFEIDLDTCRLLVLSLHEEEIWAVSNAISRKKPDEALAALAHSLDRGKQLVSILGSLAALYRKMLHCKALIAENVPKDDWQERTGMRGYNLTITMKQSRERSLEDLQRGIALLRQADEDIKGGKSEPNLVLERVLVDLCSV